MSTSPSRPRSTKIVAAPMETTSSSGPGWSDRVASMTGPDRTNRTRASGLSLRAPASARCRMSLAHSVNSTVKQPHSRVALVFAFQLFFAPAQIVFPRFETTLLVDALQEVRRVLRSDRPRRCPLRQPGDAAPRGRPRTSHAIEPTSGTMMTMSNQTSFGRFRTSSGSLEMTSKMQKIQRKSSAMPSTPSPKIMRKR